MPIDIHLHWSGRGAHHALHDYATVGLLLLDDELAAALAAREHGALAALSPAERAEAVDALAAGYVIWADESTGEYGADAWG